MKWCRREVSPRRRVGRSSTPEHKRFSLGQLLDWGYHIRSYEGSLSREMCQLRLTCRKPHGSRESQGPFTTRIKTSRIPKALKKTCHMDWYNGTTDPKKQIENVQAILDYLGVERPIKWHLYALALKKKVWKLGLRMNFAGNSPLNTHHSVNNQRRLSREEMNLSRTT